MAPLGASTYPFCFLPSHGHLNASDTTSPRPCPTGVSCLWAPRAATQERQSGDQGCCSATCSGPSEQSLTLHNCTLRTVFAPTFSVVTYGKTVSFGMFEWLRFMWPEHTMPLTMTAVCHSKIWGQVYFSDLTLRMEGLAGHFSFLCFPSSYSRIQK